MPDLPRPGVVVRRMEEAQELVEREGKASARFLKRRLHVDFRVATEILEALEEDGVVRKVEPTRANQGSPWEVVKPEDRPPEAAELVKARARAKTSRGEMKRIMRKLVTEKDTRELGPERVSLLLDLLVLEQLSERARVRIQAAQSSPYFRKVYQKILRSRLELGQGRVFEKVGKYAEGGDKDFVKIYLNLLGIKTLESEQEEEVQGTPAELDEEIRRKAKEAGLEVLPGGKFAGQGS